MSKGQAKEALAIVKDYSEYSSVQGVIYIFQANQTIIGRVFWILVVVLMLMLGTYWSVDAYNSWQENPVLTTVTTTAFPVTQVRVDHLPPKRSYTSFTEIHLHQKWLRCKFPKNITVCTFPKIDQ